MKALILVDIQNDFCPGGALAVTNGDQVVEVANKLSHKFGGLVVATQDWHPASHKSFRSNNDVAASEVVGYLNGFPQVWWPNHCVQGTGGADFHRNLNLNKVAAVFRKGMNPLVDSYSGFFDNKAVFDNAVVKAPTGLAAYLVGLGVTDVFVMGLATDYCVKFTALDAQALGFHTNLVLDGCRGVNINPDDSEKAVYEMRAMGIQVVNSDHIL